MDAVYAQVERAAAAGLVINFGLGIAKLVGGWLGNSFALISDSVNSLGDVVATLVVLVALRVARQPADAEHPYGHSRAEGVAATNVALLITLSGLWLIWESLHRFVMPQPSPSGWTMWIAAANLAVKESLFQYHRAVARRTGSSAILANAWDHRSDALCALAVLLGLAAARYGGWGTAADATASLTVALIITASGIHLFRNTASELLDLQADQEMLRQIREIALSINGVRDVETLWVRKSGLEFFADIHIEVDPFLSVREGHAIGHQVKAKLLQAFPSLRDVLVHLEPYTEESAATAAENET
ncbi:MAG: cation transporter [Planctomycetota bacterium]|nr:MAG: cation transporter [Planctomycetota bacterium]